MIVCHARRFIFFHNPKCAGTSFRDALKPFHDDDFNFWGVYYAAYFRNHIDHTHLRLWEIEAQFPAVFQCTATYNSVIFVRSPYQRFLAAVNEHMKKFQPQIDLAKMTPQQRTQVVEAFIRQVLNVARITTDWRFIHFSPQLWFLRLGTRIVPQHIIPMLADGAFARQATAALGLSDVAMPHHNPSPVDLSAALASPVVREFVRDFYADDFAFLQADPRLAELAESSADTA